MIVFIRVPRTVGCAYWLGIGVFALVVLIHHLCQPETWRGFGSFHAAPTQPTAARPADAARNGASAEDGNRAILSVHVTPDAEVFLEGQPTKPKGASRLFRTPPLTPGQDFDYEVRARWTNGDAVTDEVRKVKVRAGVRTVVDFTRPADPPQANTPTNTPQSS